MLASRLALHFRIFEYKKYHFENIKSRIKCTPTPHKVNCSQHTIRKKKHFSGIKIPLLLQMDLHEIWYYQHKIRILTVQSPEIGKTKYPSL